MAPSRLQQQRSTLSNFSIRWDRNPQLPDIPQAKIRPSDSLNQTPWLSALKGYLKACISQDGRSHIAPAYVDFVTQNFQDADNQYNWQFQNLLGSGSFGAVAHYSAFDPRGNNVDDIVTKATTNPKARGQDRGNGCTDVPVEAAVMAQLNDLNNEAFLFLRQFKLAGTIADLPTDLYYLEYCNHRSLHSWKLHYKAHKKRFPEAFLWHLLDIFSKACMSTEEGPFRNHDETVKISGRKYAWGSKIPNAYLVHGDIKPENIFVTMLDHQQTTQAPPRFPSIRVGDFGCARVLHEDLDTSRRWNVGGGTEPYMAPEIRLALLPHKLGAKAKNKRVRQITYSIASRVTSRFMTDCITPIANSWCFAAVVWELMTLREIHELSDRVEARKYRGEFNFGVEAMLEGGVMHPLAPNTAPYSKELVDLLKHCLHFNTDQRWNLAHYHDVVQENLYRWLEDGLPELDFTGPTGEWGFLSEVGDLQYDLDARFWQQFKDDARWRRELADLGYPEYVEDKFMLPFERAAGFEDINSVWQQRVEEGKRRRGNMQRTQKAVTRRPLPKSLQATRRPSNVRPRKNENVRSPLLATQREYAPLHKHTQPARVEKEENPYLSNARHDSVAAAISKAMDLGDIFEKQQYRAAAPLPRQRVYQAYSPGAIQGQGLHPPSQVQPTRQAYNPNPVQQPTHSQAPQLPEQRKLSAFNPDAAHLPSFAGTPELPRTRPRANKSEPGDRLRLEAEDPLHNQSRGQGARQRQQRRERVAAQPGMRTSSRVTSRESQAERNAIWAEGYIAEKKRREGPEQVDSMDIDDEREEEDMYNESRGGGESVLMRSRSGKW